ncbi:MAG: aminotransferase class I/II-fold pyridoxal phosphate-dependent enzyme [Acidobacteria bacterium]|nr:aminotransferase class I/II-fold pyridoxal phosphate-dependent enzyme [Acidobacteriota bacterium]
MQIHTKAVHSGDRKKPGPHTPSTTPIHTATSYFYDSMSKLDRIFGGDEAGFSYARFDNPSAAALEELCASLENGAAALACASGMAALHTAILAALTDRPKSIVAASALYGQTVTLLMNVLSPLGIEVRFADACDPDAMRAAVAEARPGCVFIESISNPLLRVAPLDSIARIAREAGAALVVDHTFATPLLARPLDLGAHFSVHSLTKFLAGHGDVLGGIVVTDAAHAPVLRALGRNVGPVLGPFECYLAMRGIKTFPLRMERQCANAGKVAEWLAGQARVARVYYPGDTAHPDAATVARLFPAGMSGAMVSFEIRDGGREEVFGFMDSLKLIVRATSLGDVHSMMLYPVMSSHRDLSPKHRQRMGIGENLVRLSVGIEAAEDIIGDLAQALG